MKRKKNVIVDVCTMLIYMFLFLISSESLNGQLISAMTAVLSFLVVVIYACYNRCKITFYVNAFHIWVFIFAGFCYVSALWAMDSGLAIAKGNTILKNAICVFLIYICYQSNTSIKNLLKLVMYSGYAVVILGIGMMGLDNLGSLLSAATRISNSFLNANTLGMLISFTLLLHTYFLIYYKEEKKAIFLAVIAVVLLALSGSRKSIIEIVLGLLMIFVLRNYTKKDLANSIGKILLSIIALVIALYFLSKLPMFDFVTGRIQNIFKQLSGSGNTDYSIRSRAMLDVYGVQIFMENPIIGIGMDCARIIIKQKMGIDWYLHNNYLELMADGGVIGLLFYYVFYLMLLRRFIKFKAYRDPEYDIVLVLFVVQMVLEFAFVSYYSRETYFYLMMFFLETEILRKKWNAKKKMSVNFSNEVTV